MSRRHAAKQDSLELLLDTICNTFGGVLFIAILVVLLLQQTGTGPASAPVVIPVSDLEMQSLMSRMEEVTDELTRMRQNRDSQDAIVQTFAPDAVQQLLAVRSDTTTRQESVQAEVDQLLASNVVLVKQVEGLAIENDSVREQLDQARARLRAVQSRIEEERRSRVEEVRLPVVRTAMGKQEIGLVLRYGRLYVWHKYGRGYERLGLNTDDFVVVSKERDGLVTRPNPLAGVSLDESLESQEKIRRVLRRFDPQSCYFAIIARPDSYSVFRRLRDRVIELGFEYRLIPVGADDPVSDRGGTGGRVQ
ncbi:MAG: hypothetical protein WCH39_09595 [Schlesneria sp.]